MGKKSLIKSTTKKKADTKTKEEKPAQKTSAKAPPKAPAKAVKKSTAAKTAAKQGSTAAKAPGTDKPAAQPKSAPKKLSAKEILFLRFTQLQPAPQKASAAKPSAMTGTAPPLITTEDPQEAARLRTVLTRRFSMDAIQAAARVQPAPEAEEKKSVASPKAETKPEPKAETAAAKASSQTTAHQRPEPAPYVSVEATATETCKADPVSRSIKIASSAIILLILILLAVSANNSAKYYLKTKDDAVEIWKGDFSPKDKHFFMVLHGVNVTEPVKPVYSKKEVYPLIFNYYLDKSDALLEVKGLPDFDGIRQYLHKAEGYAVTGEMKAAVTERLNTIKRMTLLYKADVAISRNTLDSLESAISILKDAGKLSPSTAQSEEIAQKIATARQAIATLKAGPPVQEEEKQSPKD
jgi:hypothetical protein